MKHPNELLCGGVSSSNSVNITTTQLILTNPLLVLQLSNRVRSQSELIYPYQKQVENTSSLRKLNIKATYIDSIYSLYINTNYSLGSRLSICLLDVLRDPLKAFTISHLADDAAHEHFKRADIGVGQIS